MSNMRGKFYVKVIAAVVAAIFLHQQIVWAEGAPAPAALPAHAGENTALDRSKVDARDIDLPYNLAHRDEVYSGAREETIIHLQDAHASLSAQYSLVNLLDVLAKDYDLEFIALEGTEGVIDTSLLKSFPDKDIREKTADLLMREGRMSAGEFFQITRDEKNIMLCGVEDNALYKENLDEFCRVIEQREFLVKMAEAFKSQIVALEEKVYSKELREFIYKGRAHKKGMMSFVDYWRETRPFLDKFGIETSTLRDMPLLIRSINLEEKINFEKANTERTDLISELTGRLEKKELETLVLESVNFKEQKISPANFHKYLERLAQENNISISGYKNFSMFTEYISLYESVDIFNLYSEVESLEKRVRDKLYRTDDERELNEMFTMTELLRGLYSIELSSRDFGFLKAYHEKYDAKKFAAFLKNKCGKYNVTIEKGYDLAEMIGGMDEAVNFYETAAKRDRLMIENTLKRMKDEKKRVAALITGGYHTKGLTQIMKENKLSYLIISPKFEKDEERPYIAILTGKKKPYQELIDTGKYQIMAAAWNNPLDGIDAQLLKDQEIALLVGGLTGLYKSGNWKKVIEDWKIDIDPNADIREVLGSLVVRRIGDTVLAGLSDVPMVALTKDKDGNPKRIKVSRKLRKIWEKRVGINIPDLKDVTSKVKLETEVAPVLYKPFVLTRERVEVICKRLMDEADSRPIGQSTDKLRKNVEKAFLKMGAPKTFLESDTGKKQIQRIMDELKKDDENNQPNKADQIFVKPDFGDEKSWNEIDETIKGFQREYNAMCEYEASGTSIFGRLKVEGDKNGAWKNSNKAASIFGKPDSQDDAYWNKVEKDIEEYLKTGATVFENIVEEVTLTKQQEREAIDVGENKKQKIPDAMNIFKDVVKKAEEKAKLELGVVTDDTKIEIPAQGRDDRKWVEDKLGANTTQGSEQTANFDTKTVDLTPKEKMEAIDVEPTAILKDTRNVSPEVKKDLLEFLASTAKDVALELDTNPPAIAKINDHETGSRAYLKSFMKKIKAQFMRMAFAGTIFTALMLIMLGVTHNQAKKEEESKFVAYVKEVEEKTVDEADDVTVKKDNFIKSIPGKVVKFIKDKANLIIRHKNLIIMMFGFIMSIAVITNAESFGFVRTIERVSSTPLFATSTFGMVELMMVMGAVALTVWVFLSFGKGEIGAERKLPIIEILRKETCKLDIIVAGVFAYQTIIQYMADGAFTKGVFLFAIATAALIFSVWTFIKDGLFVKAAGVENTETKRIEGDLKTDTIVMTATKNGESVSVAEVTSRKKLLFVQSKNWLKRKFALAKKYKDLISALFVSSIIGLVSISQAYDGSVGLSSSSIMAMAVLSGCTIGALVFLIRSLDKTKKISDKKTASVEIPEIRNFKELKGYAGISIVTSAMTLLIGYFHKPLWQICLDLPMKHEILGSIAVGAGLLTSVAVAGIAILFTWITLDAAIPMGLKKAGSFVKDIFRFIKTYFSVFIGTVFAGGVLLRTTVAGAKGIGGGALLVSPKAVMFPWIIAAVACINAVGLMFLLTFFAEKMFSKQMNSIELFCSSIGWSSSTVLSLIFLSDIRFITGFFNQMIIGGNGLSVPGIFVSTGSAALFAGIFAASIVSTAIMLKGIYDFFIRGRKYSELISSGAVAAAGIISAGVMTYNARLILSWAGRFAFRGPANIIFVAVFGTYGLIGAIIAGCVTIIAIVGTGAELRKMYSDKKHTRGALLTLIMFIVCMVLPHTPAVKAQNVYSAPETIPAVKITEPRHDAGVYVEPRTFPVISDAPSPKTSAGGVEEKVIPLTGWYAETWYDSQGIIDVYEEGGILKIVADLRGQDDNRSKGEIYRDFSIPQDFTNRKLVFQVRVPEKYALNGDNGVEPFMKDWNWNNQYADRVKITRAGEWVTIEMVPLPYGRARRKENNARFKYTDPGFDPLSGIRRIGVKFVIDEKFQDTFVSLNPDETVRDGFLEVAGIKILPVEGVVHEAEWQNVYRDVPIAMPAIGVETFVANSGISLYLKMYERAIGTPDGVTARYEETLNEFKKYAEKGIKNARVLLCMGSKDTSGIEFDESGDMPIGFKDQELAILDIANLIRIGSETDIKLDIVLHNKDITETHSGIFSDEENWEALLALDRIALNGAKDICGEDAWKYFEYAEILNEPDDAGLVSWYTQQVVKAGNTMIRNDIGKPVTLGPDKIEHVGNWLLSSMLKPGDMYQIHCYNDNLEELLAELRKNIGRFIVPEGVKICYGEAQVSMYDTESRTTDSILYEVFLAAHESGADGVYGWFDNRFAPKYTLDKDEYERTTEYMMSADYDTDVPDELDDTELPIAHAAVSDQTADEGVEISFDAGESTDESGVIETYSWDFDDYDGIQEDAGTVTATHTYDKPGVYTATLTVTDPAGNSGTDTLTITVNEVVVDDDTVEPNDTDDGDVIDEDDTVTDDTDEPASTLDTDEGCFIGTAWFGNKSEQSKELKHVNTSIEDVLKREGVGNTLFDKAARGIKNIVDSVKKHFGVFVVTLSGAVLSATIAGAQPYVDLILKKDVVVKELLVGFGGVVMLLAVVLVGSIIIRICSERYKYRLKETEFKIVIGLPEKIYNKSLREGKETLLEGITNGVQIISLKENDDREIMQKELNEKIKDKRVIGMIVDSSVLKDDGDFDVLVPIIKDFIKTAKKEITPLMAPKAGFFKLQWLTRGAIKKDFEKLEKLTKEKTKEWDKTIQVLVRTLPAESLQLMNKGAYHIPVNKWHRAVVGENRVSSNAKHFAQGGGGLCMTQNKKYISVSAYNLADMRFIANAIKDLGIDSKKASEFIHVRLRNDNVKTQENLIEYMKKTGLDGYLNAKNVDIISEREEKNMTLNKILWKVKHRFGEHMFTINDDQIFVGSTKDLNLSSEDREILAKDEKAPVFIQMKGEGIISQLLFTLVEFSASGEIPASLGKIALDPNNEGLRIYIYMPKIKKADYNAILDVIKNYEKMMMSV